MTLERLYDPIKGWARYRPKRGDMSRIAENECSTCDGGGVVYRTGKGGLHGGCPAGCQECVYFQNPEEVILSLRHIADDLAAGRESWMGASIPVVRAAARLLTRLEEAEKVMENISKMDYTLDAPMGDEARLQSCVDAARRWLEGETDG